MRLFKRSIDKKKVLHIAKQIIIMEKRFNLTIDSLLETLGVTRKEIEGKYADF